MLIWNILLSFAIEILPQCITATQPSVDQTIYLDSTTPSVTITSPGFESGTYPANTDFKWEIVAQEPQKINLTFQVFNLEYHPHCIWDYVRLSDTNCLGNHHGLSPQTFCGIKTSLEYLSSSSVMCVEFHSDIINHRQGFEAVAKIKEETSSFVESTWQPTTTSEASLLNSKSTPQSNYNIAVTIQPSTTIDLSQIKTIYDVSQSSSHQILEQISTLVYQSQISSNLQTPIVSIKSSPVLSIEPVSKPQAQSTDSAHEDIATSTPFLSTTMTSQNSLLSSLDTTDSAASSIGVSDQDLLPTKDVTLARGSMGAINVVTYSEIRIRTPKDATGKYPVNFNSVLNIYNPEKCSLTLTFDSFRVENSYYCSWDYLVIYTPQSSGPLCGYTVPQPIETDTESVHLHFHSDLIVPDVGFVIRIKIDHPGTSTQPSSPSSTAISSSIGPSLTPGSTSLLQQSTTLTSLFIMETSKLQLTIDSELSPSSIKSVTISTLMKSQVLQDTNVLKTSSQTLPILPTTTTYVSSSDSPLESSSISSMSPSGTTTSHLLDSTKTLAPTTTVKPSHITTNVFSSIIFKLTTTQSSTSRASESPTQQTEAPLPEINVCNFSDISVSAAPEIIVKSPKDENGHYPVNLHCQMKIMNSEHKNLKVKFTEFRVEQNSFCVWDYLIIYTSDKYGPLCGYKLPPDLVTNSDEITLTFRSDAIIPDTGFVMHINVQQDSTNQSSTTATETTTSNFMSSPDLNNTLLNKTQTSTDPSVNNVTSGQTKVKPSTFSLIPTGTESSGQTKPQSKTSPLIPVTSMSTGKTSLLTVITLSTRSSTKQTSQSSASNIPTTASLSAADASSSTTQVTTSTSVSTAAGPNVITTNSGANTLPTGLYQELDICSQNPLEIEENIVLISPGFSNGLDYPLNIACNKTVTGDIGERIVLTIEVFNVEQNSVCLWDALNIHFKDQHVKLCGYVIPGQLLDNHASCETDNFVQYSYGIKSRICFLDNNLSHTFVFTTTETLMFRFRSDHIVARQGFKILLQRIKATIETFTSTVFSPASASKLQHSKFPTTPQVSTITTKKSKAPSVSPLTSTQNPNLSSEPSFSSPVPSTSVSAYTSTSVVTKLIPTATSTSVVTKLIPTASSIPTLSSKPKLSSDQQPFHDGSGSKTFTMTSPISTAVSSVSSSPPTMNMTESSTYFPESTKSKQVNTSIKLTTSTKVQTKAIPGDALTSTTKSSLIWTSLSNQTSLSSIKSSLLTTQFTSSANNFTPTGTTDSPTTTAETKSMTNSPGSLETKATTSAPFSSKSPLTSTTSYVTSASVVSNQNTESTSYGSNETMTGQPISQPPSMTYKTSVTTTSSNLAQSSSMTQVATQASDSSSATSPSVDTLLTPACLPNNEPFSLSDTIGYIESPKIQNLSTYPPNILCRWKINDMEGKFVSLIFEWFDIEKSSGCELDKLGIYRTLSDNDRQTVAVLCGNKLPETLTVSGEVLIEFQSNAHGEKTGFRLKFIKTDKINEDPTLNCLPGMTPCWATKICMPVEWICDGEVNCPDMSDEAKCECVTG